MNLKATSSVATAASTGSLGTTQPIKKIANAGEAFEKYKMKLQEKNERVSQLRVSLKQKDKTFFFLKGKIFKTKRRS